MNQNIMNKTSITKVRSRQRVRPAGYNQLLFSLYNSAQVWCPSESPEVPATTKLLQACNMVFDLFEIEEETHE